SSVTLSFLPDLAFGSIETFGLCKLSPFFSFPWQFIPKTVSCKLNVIFVDTFTFEIVGFPIIHLGLTQLNILIYLIPKKLFLDFI
ncbi:hypothetical protein BpHYR1_002012, partial [Brachionus plicatilis]